MPVGGISGNMQHYGVGSTSADTRAQNNSSSELTRNLYKVEQSAYGFRRGHQRQNATDFRVVTSIDSRSFGAPVSRATTTLVDKLGSGARIKP